MTEYKKLARPGAKQGIKLCYDSETKVHPEFGSFFEQNISFQLEYSFHTDILRT